MGKNISEAWEQCGPGADGNPASEGNAYLSTGLGNEVSGFGSTIPDGGGAPACTMIFKGADSSHLTIYARAPVATGTGCDNPASNTGGSATVLFNGALTTLPASSAYGRQLKVNNTQTADPALDDFYATVTRGGAFKARCPAGTSPLKMQGIWDYTASGDANDTKVANNAC